MGFSYDQLWTILKEKNMTREELKESTGMSSATIAKLGKNEAINMRSLEKICRALDCDIGDIVRCNHNREEMT